MSKRIGCEACRRDGNSGRLLPYRPGVMRCFSCRREVPDRWDLAPREGIHAYEGHYASWALFARQLWEMRERQQGCRHPEVIVATRPWCGRCGVEVPRGHWGYLPALASVTKTASREVSAGGAFAEVLRDAARRGSHT
jgi:hypothetical protein